MYESRVNKFSGHHSQVAQAPRHEGDCRYIHTDTPALREWRARSLTAQRRSLGSSDCSMRWATGAQLTRGNSGALQSTSAAAAQLVMCSNSARASEVAGRWR